MNQRQADQIFAWLGMDHDMAERSAFQYMARPGPLVGMNEDLQADMALRLSQVLSEPEMKVFEALTAMDQRQHADDSTLTCRMRVIEKLENTDAREISAGNFWQVQLKNLAQMQAADCQTIVSSCGTQDVSDWGAAQTALTVLHDKTAKLVEDFCRDQIRRQAWQLSGNVSQLLGSGSRCHNPEVSDLQRGLRALDLDYETSPDQMQLAAVRVTQELTADGSLIRQPLEARALSGMGVGLTQLPWFSMDSCAVNVYQDDQSRALLVSSSAAGDGVHDGVDYATVCEIRVMCPGHQAEELAERLRQAPDARAAQAVCRALSQPAGELYQQALQRGLRKLAMQESVQSLTASQKDDSLSEGLKQGGRGRH